MNSNFNLNNLVRKNIAELKPYSSARDEFKGLKEDMVFLDANENPYPSEVNRYPDPYQTKVKEKISQIKQLPIENMLLGNGSDEILDLIFRSFCEPGIDNCISLPPTYGMYKVLAGINNIENREVLLNHEFQPDVTAILNEVNENTKLIFFCSPNNPTGNIMERERIQKILENFNGIVLIDEAYIDFSETDSWLNSLQDYPNLIVTQTFSKAYGMAAIRLGMCFASSEIINILNKIKPPYNVNNLTQTEALKKLSDFNLVQSQVFEIKQEKQSLSKVLLEIEYIAKIYKSEANFILIEVDDANKRYQQLLDLGIVVRNRTNQPLCNNCLRLSVGTPQENAQLLKALKEIE